MTKSEKQKLITTNAAIWAAATLTSFVLPLISESIADGPWKFFEDDCASLSARVCDVDFNRPDQQSHRPTNGMKYIRPNR